MKRTLKIIAILAASMLFTACGKQEVTTQTEITTQSAEAVETATAEALKILESPEPFLEIGVFVDAPQDAKDVSYCILEGDIAEIDFTYHEVQYVLRGSTTDKQLDFDVTDEYDILEDTIDNSQRQAVIKTTVGGLRTCFWSYNGANYALMSRQNVDRDEFSKLSMWFSFPD
ncbi:MAG: hypothetical protein IJR59_02025 [Firmicutes bacterium]|nr:hypothetical protein [Bacillota bacterium]